MVRVAVFQFRKRVCNYCAAYLALRRYCIASGNTAAALAPSVVPTMTEPLAGKPGQSQGPTPGNLDKVALQRKFGWLWDHSPGFGLSGKNVSVISNPSDFFKTFKGMVSGARRRIVIASLYLGTGSLEEELVRSIDEACQNAADRDQPLEVHILLDYNRGSRGAPSSRTMLLPLLERHGGARDQDPAGIQDSGGGDGARKGAGDRGSSVHVYLYHTPDLRGLMKYYLSERFNEVVGLNHMKIYMVDDDFIISGANLSDSYFTDRQDRYIQIRSCPRMADYFLSLVQAVSKFSFHLQSDDSEQYPQNAPHPYEGSDPPEVFKTFARETVQSVIKDFMTSTQSQTVNQAGDTTPADSDCDTDTWLFPLIQMGPFGIDDDEKVTQMVFRQSEESDRIKLASGYFNLTDQYRDAIIKESRAKFDILAASPEANGFLGSRGLSGYVPSVYTHVAHQFHTQVCRTCQQGRISLHEYYRRGWTFHCKGLWYYTPGVKHPVLSFIGSPNFGYRSSCRDLECQVIIMTTNPSLQQQLHQEQEAVYGQAQAVSEETFQKPERYVPLWVRLMTRIVKNFF